MSSGPQFKSIILLTTSGMRLWTLTKKVWTEVDAKLSLDKKPSSEVVALTQGDNVLVLVGDAFTGHIQFISPNKKDLLTDEALGERLQSEYQIDVSAYEFATQRATLSRSQIQVSVSGVETEVYRRIVAWVEGLKPRKTWIMPFGWFLAPLKSVEPVLLAVVDADEQVLVSHHYLGVDDARELSLSDLPDYVTSRKEERKETHLLYVQGSPKVLKKLETALEDHVAVHPLLADSEGDIWTEVITAVMSKGGDTLAELLHFEEDGLLDDESGQVGEAADAPVVVPPAKPTKAKAAEDAVDAEVDSDASSLPVPNLPAPVVPVPVAAGMSRSRSGSTVEVEEDDDVDDDSVSDDDFESTDDLDDDSDESDESSAVVEVASVSPVEDSEDDEETPVIAVAAKEAAAPEQTSGLSRLAAEKLMRPTSTASNPERYRHVEQKRSWGGVILVFLIVTIVTALVGGAVFWSQQVRPTQQVLIPSDTAPTPTPEPTPTPTPAPVTLTLAQKKQLNTAVYNATTRAGLAGRYQSALREAGWTVPTAGNATGEYAEAGVYVFTADEGAFQTLAEELQGVTVRRLETNPETSPSTINVVIVINQPVEPEVTPAE